MTYGVDLYPLGGGGGGILVKLQTRTEFQRMADLSLATSLEKERVRDYFLDNNDGWQMQALTRHVEEDEDRQRQQREDAVADKVREGDVLRQGGGGGVLMITHARWWWWRGARGGYSRFPLPPFSGVVKAHLVPLCEF